MMLKNIFLKKKIWFLLISVCLTQLCQAVDIDYLWRTTKFQDGGSIKLPSSFTAIRTSSELKKSNDGNTSSYSQLLLKAKGVKNNVVCSVSISRGWKEDKLNNLIIHDNPREMLTEYTQGTIDMTLALGSYSLHKPLSYQKIQDKLFCRYSIVFNNDASRLDGFACYKKGILYYGSAVYSRNEEEYWSSTFSSVLESLVFGQNRDKSTAEDDKLSNRTQKWQQLELDGGSALWIPENWLCIYKNADAVEESLFPYTVFTQTLLDARPSLYEGDISTFHIYRIYFENSLTKQVEKNTKEDISDIESSFVEGILEGATGVADCKTILGPTLFSIHNKNITMRKYRLAFPFGANLIKTYCFVENDIIYFLMLNHPEKDNAVWDDLMDSVLKRWSFGPGNSTGAGLKTPFEPEDADAETPSIYNNHLSNPSSVATDRNSSSVTTALLGRWGCGSTAYQFYSNGTFDMIETSGTKQLTYTVLEGSDQHNWIRVDCRMPSGKGHEKLIQLSDDRLRADVTTVFSNIPIKSKWIYKGDVSVDSSATGPDVITISDLKIDTQIPLNDNSTSLFVITLLVSFLVTWGIGLAPPLLIRYAILRRPLSKTVAIVIVAVFWFINIGIFTALGSQSKTHAALFFVAWVSYFILHKGYNSFSTAGLQPKSISNSTPESLPLETESVPISSGRLEQCSNCGRAIGKLEHSYSHTGNILCVGCYQSLESGNNEEYEL